MKPNVVLAEASAPGRLDVMGGIADYSGSLVLQMPIRQQTTVKLALRDDFICNIHSETSTGEKLSATLDYRGLLQHQDVSYAYARGKFKQAWIAYIVGCALVLQKERNIDFRGADFYIHSDVPLGKGVSSSASLEIATMKALAQAFGVSFSGTALPTLAQRVENHVVGAPCGLMDQLASGFGEAGKLLPILCQPDKIGEPVAVPEDVFFIGIDSGVRHSVGGASYGDVRCGAFMGYTVIAQSLGIDKAAIERARQENDSSGLPFRGYLCNISVAEFENKFAALLPRTIMGKEFLSRYGTTTDRVTEVKEDTAYAIHQSTMHPVYENERVHKFMHLLKETLHLNGPAKQEHLRQMGELMYQSHESYSRCGLGSERTDEIVDLMRLHHAEGIAGAKITGGGSGGTVCALAIGEAGKRTVERIHRQLCEKYNTNLVLFE
jgi:galactokinase